MAKISDARNWQEYVAELQRKCSEARSQIVKTGSDEETLQWRALVEKHKLTLIQTFPDKELKECAAFHILIGSTPREEWSPNTEIPEKEGFDPADVSVEQFYQGIIGGKIKPLPESQWPWYLQGKLKPAMGGEAAEQVFVPKEATQSFRKKAERTIKKNMRGLLETLHRK